MVFLSAGCPQLLRDLAAEARPARRERRPPCALRKTISMLSMKLMGLLVEAASGDSISLPPFTSRKER